MEKIREAAANNIIIVSAVGNHGAVFDASLSPTPVRLLTSKHTW
jgi:hypothetical protein